VRITILNGDPVRGSALDGYLDGMVRRLSASGNDVVRLDLAEMDIRGCTGCWGCWVKTPGECVARDDSADVCRAVVSADLMLLASPMRMGFTSALLKRTADKLIPLVHPYITIEGGEMHHLPRYDRYPLLGLLLEAGADTDEEDIAITRAMWERTARNLKSRLAFVAVTDRCAEEVADELAAVA
jgi:hypothetical protein